MGKYGSTVSATLIQALKEEVDEVDLLKTTSGETWYVWQDALSELPGEAEIPSEQALIQKLMHLDRCNP